MANNFLTRKKLDLNLINRDGYKKSDVKKTHVHPFMKSPITHIPSVFPYNPDQLGFYIPYLHDKNTPYEIHEERIFIDSADRDAAVNPNPYQMNVKFGVNDTNLVVSYPPVKNIKYINVDNIILPYLFELKRESIANDTSFNALLNADISNGLIAVNGEYTVSNTLIQVCNLKVASASNWEINYTKNRDKTTVFNVIKSNNTFASYKYTVDSSYVSKKTIYLKLDNIESNLLSTSQKDAFQQLYPKKIIANSLWFNIKKSNIVFKTNNLLSISKLDISFVDDTGNTLKLYNLDYSTTTGKYTDKSLFSSPDYYLRHPLHKRWQSHITLKLGIVDPFLKPSL